MRTTVGAIKMPKRWPQSRPDFGGYSTSKRYEVARFGLGSHRMVQKQIHRFPQITPIRFLESHFEHLTKDLSPAAKTIQRGSKKESV
jgi:hypothetical protein